MRIPHMLKAGILAFILVAIGTLCWEYYLRGKGFFTSYDDGGPLWSHARSKVYDPIEQSTVFIGSSRIKYDLDIDTWQKLTGDNAVQLAMVGSSPLPILEHLANDEKFKGRLLIDVTEGLFFSTGAGSRTRPMAVIKHHKEATPAQRAGFELTRIAESKLVFLDKEGWGLNALLERLRLGVRDTNIFLFPPFPPEFGNVNFERQSLMTNELVKDTNIQNQVKYVWTYLRRMNPRTPPNPTVVDSLMQVVKKDIDRIRSRGGEVMFVRTPSSGVSWVGEQMGFPREKYWDKLLAVTNVQGIHFMDYEGMKHFICPEWSHLTPDDAVIYTKHLITAMEEKGWKFPNKPTVASR